MPEGDLGRTVLVKWKAVACAGVRDKSPTMNGEPVDLTAGEDDGRRVLHTEPGEDTIDVSLNGIVRNDTLKADWFARERTGLLELIYPDGAKIAGQFFMASYSEGLPYKDGMTFDSSMQSTGEVVYTPPAVPANTVLPAISGVAQAGEPLTALPGVWSGAVSFTYQWENEGAPIGGATNQVYIPVVGDVGDNLTVVVTAHNGAGTASAESAPTPDVLAAA